jgi:hypothetical protein
VSQVVATATAQEQKVRRRVELAAPTDNLTAAQASQYLQIPVKTLAVWRSTNRVPLPFFRIGVHIRYRRSDLDAFIASTLQNVGAAS